MCESETEGEEKKEKENRFERFWNAYPKKVRKDHARREFIKIDPDADTFDKIMTSVEKNKESDAWKNDGGRYIPFAENWLSDRRYEDEIELPEDNSGSFDVNDFFQLAVKRSYEEIRSRKRNRDDEGSPKDEI